MKTLDMPQGSPEWFTARMGVITASEADALVTPKWKVRTGDGVDTYLYKKVAEKVFGWSAEQVAGYALDQGKILETIAIPWFEFEYSTKVKRVGFCLTDDGVCGCSPDGILPDGSGLEIKSPQAPNHIRYLCEGVLPEAYAAQVHFSMFVTGAPRWTFVSYNNHINPFVTVVQRDEAIQAVIKTATEAFAARLAACAEKVRAQ